MPKIRFAYDTEPITCETVGRDLGVQVARLDLGPEDMVIYADKQPDAAKLETMRARLGYEVCDVSDEASPAVAENEPQMRPVKLGLLQRVRSWFA